MTASQKVWFITGCSTGFGRALAQEVLAAGHKAVVTARDVAQVKDLVEGTDRALALPLDVTDAAQVKEAVQAAERHFGRIDVLVNNAGIGYFAAVEESTETRSGGSSTSTSSACPTSSARSCRACAPGAREQL